MRKIHRWIAIVAVVFLVVVASTGVLLQAQKFTGADEDDPDNAPSSTALSTTTAPTLYTGIVERALAVAKARAPGVPIVSVTVKMGENQPTVLIRLPGAPGRQITVDGRSGKLLADEPFEPETLLKRIHDGSILGDPGVVMGVLWGLALVVLTITGFWVYLDLYRRRARVQGKGKLFW